MTHQNKLEAIKNVLKQIQFSLESDTEIHQISLDIAMEKTRFLYEKLLEFKHEFSQTSFVSATNELQIKIDHPIVDASVQNKRTDFVVPKIEAVSPNIKAESVTVDNNTIAEPELPAEPEFELLSYGNDLNEENDTIWEMASNLNPSQNSAIPVSKSIEESKPIEQAPTVTAQIDEKPIISQAQSSPVGVEPNQTSIKLSIAEKFEAKKSLNDRLSEIKRNTDLASLLEKRPIKDMKSAISINDRIWFIKELFAGNVEKYKTTIDLIDQCGHSDQAIELVAEFKWDMDSSAAKHFIELIYRRFLGV